MTGQDCVNVAEHRVMPSSVRDENFPTEVPSRHARHETMVLQMRVHLARRMNMQSEIAAP